MCFIPTIAFNTTVLYNMYYYSLTLLLSTLLEKQLPHPILKTQFQIIYSRYCPWNTTLISNHSILIIFLLTL